MKRIYPICEAECAPHYGKPVCVILRDGTEVMGVMSCIENGKLILGTDNTAEAEVEALTNAALPAAKRSKRSSKLRTSSSKLKRAASSKARKQQVTTSAYPYGPYPYPYPGFRAGRIALDLALITLLLILI
ncbi:hypothetical protein [Paenibacillus sp. YYML68]|uniref:hypothetical protein n=1 Tax=Paenibacillus sp. YYML68 TaxID=2909250 RepID=UPI0024933F91|nr:hypothetical protein [Paenibacillus sp. YYML68]